MFMNTYYYMCMNGSCTGAPGEVLLDSDSLYDWYIMLDMGGEL